jgi:syntaxin 8
LKQFKSELQQLNDKLRYIANTLTRDETERRQRQIEALQSKQIQLERQFAIVDDEESATRTKLFSAGSTKLWDDDSDDAAIIQPDASSSSVSQMRAEQTRLLEDQDQGLEALSKVISRQKSIAHQINQEVDLHNEILDNLGSTMERTDNRMTTETQNIGTVIRKESTWGYWTIIIALFVAICVVALV